MHRGMRAGIARIAHRVAAIVVAVQIVCVSNQANAQATVRSEGLPPRLFHATKDEKSIFLLAVSHVGLEEERDEYADEVVRYVIRRIGTIYDESASVGTAFNVAERRQCADGSWSVDLRKEVVDTVVKATHGSLGQAIAAAEMPEAALYWLLAVYGGFDDANRVVVAGVAVHRGLARLYGVPLKSIETMTELIAAYCSADKLVRENAANAALGKGESNFSRLTLNDAKRLFGSSVATQQSDRIFAVDTIGRDPESKLIFGTRNYAWAKSVAQRVTNSSLGADLYALGAGHFVDTLAGPSILTTLQAEGFSVKRVTSVSDVVPVLPSLPVHNLAAQPYDAKRAISTSSNSPVDQATCTVVGVNNMCFASLRSGEIVNWVDSSTAFTFTTCAPLVFDTWGRNQCNTVAVNKKVKRAK